MSALAQIGALITKDLTRELRSREVLTTTIAFATLLILIFAFSFYRTDERTTFIFPGILWVSIVFTGTLTVNRAFGDERESGCLRALALIPGTGTSLYVSKLVTTLIFIAGFELFLTPMLMLSFDVSIAGRWPLFLASIAAGTLGFSALGVLVAAMLVHHRLREAMVPLLLYPLIAPLLIAGVKSVGIALEGGSLEAGWEWVRAMIVMDVVFIAGGQALFRWVLSAIES
jgi:heme exporter protein B